MAATNKKQNQQGNMTSEMKEYARYNGGKLNGYKPTTTTEQAIMTSAGAHPATATNASTPKQTQNTQNTQTGGYTQSQNVEDAWNNLQKTIADNPGNYTESDAVKKAQQNVDDALANKPGAYTPSENVIAAMNALQQTEANRPESYSSKYTAQLDSVLNQILNPQAFKYEFNGDALFKQYADLYTQKGKQASLDAMGQAAGLTGGYGNSYAQQVGNQAYDQYLLNLYDKGLELRDRAYQQYLDEQSNRYNQYSTLQGADQVDYNRYRDTVGDWYNDRDYYANRYDTERNIDYNQYRDTVGDWKDELNYYTNDLYNQRDFDYNKYRDTVNDYTNNRGYYTDLYNNLSNTDYNRYADTRDYDRGVLESDRAYDRGVLESDRAYDRSVLESDRNYELSKQQLEENIRQFNENNQLSRDELAERIREFDVNIDTSNMSERRADAVNYALAILQNGQMPSAELLELAGLSEEDAQKIMAKIQQGGSPSGGSQKYYVTDANGNLYEADSSGNMRRGSDGKPVQVNVNDIPENGRILTDNGGNPQMGNQFLDAMEWARNIWKKNK